MISFDKFKTLKKETALKKATLIVSSKIHDGKSVLDPYCMEVYKHLCSTDFVDKTLMDSLIERVKNGENQVLIAEYFKGLSGLGDVNWDYIKDNHTLLKNREIHECYLVLDNIRSPYNLGAIFRTAESFFIKKIFILGSENLTSHLRAIRTSCGTINLVDHENINVNQLIEFLKDNVDIYPFSLECGGKDINSFNFPQKGICFIGNEEFGVSKELLNLSRSVVSIKTFGVKGSINVSVAAGILLNSWGTKLFSVRNK